MDRPTLNNQLNSQSPIGRLIPRRPSHRNRSEPRSGQSPVDQFTPSRPSHRNRVDRFTPNPRSHRNRVDRFIPYPPSHRNLAQRLGDRDPRLARTLDHQPDNRIEARTRLRRLSDRSSQSFTQSCSRATKVILFLPSHRNPAAPFTLIRRRQPSLPNRQDRFTLSQPSRQENHTSTQLGGPNPPRRQAFAQFTIPK